MSNLDVSYILVKSIQKKNLRTQGGIMMSCDLAIVIRIKQKIS